MLAIDKVENLNFAKKQKCNRKTYSQKAKVKGIAPSLCPKLQT